MHKTIEYVRKSKSGKIPEYFQDKESFKVSDFKFLIKKMKIFLKKC